MRINKRLLALVLFLMPSLLFAAVVLPSPTQPTNIPAISLSAHGPQPGAGKRTLKERIILKLVEKRLLKKWMDDENLTERQKKQATLSLIFGVTSLIFLALYAVPFLGLLSIPLAIAGLVLGIKSLKGNSNTKGLIGTIASAATIVVALLTVVILAALFSGWSL